MALLLLSASAQAQTADTTASSAAPTPADAVTEAPPLPRPAIVLAGPEPGRAVTPVAAVTSALNVEALLGLLPGAFDYRLGAPGRSAGVSLDGLDPNRGALLLDGRPFDDLLTGAPRLDLLPLATLGPVRRSDGRLGQPVSLDASVRPFRLGRPVTELRYLTGQYGIQAVSATHAQTRLPPLFLRGGSPDARLTASLHVMSRNARGTLAGATLRHTDALGRLALTRPGTSVETGVLYTDRTDGARRGVVPEAAPSIFDLSATAIDAGATRRTLRAEAFSTARFRLLTTQPTTVTTSLVSQRLVYENDTSDTLRVHVRRGALRLSQPLGGARLLRLDGTLDAAPNRGDSLLGSPPTRLRLHAALRDSVQLGRAQATVEGGAHLDGARAFPSAAVRLTRSGAFASARLGGALPGRIEATGLSGFITEAPAGLQERTATGDAGFGDDQGPLRLGLRAFGSVRWNARLLVARDTAFAYETATVALTVVGATATAGLRERAARGLYGRLGATAAVPLRPDGSDLSRRTADALPRLHVTARLGARASGIGGGVLDVDLAVTGRAWSAFRSRVTEPRTGLLALPDPATDLGADLPGRGILGIEALATLADRATLFLQLDHAVGEVSGAALVQGEPLPVRVLRFGVFWALLD